jgi:hypothetical protein
MLPIFRVSPTMAAVVQSLHRWRYKTIVELQEKPMGGGCGLDPQDTYFTAFKDAVMNGWVS